MAKDTVTGQDAPETTEAVAAPVTTDTLIANVATAEQGQAQAEQAFRDAGASGDVKSMLAAAETLKAAQRAVEKARNQLTAATWEAKNAEREQWGHGLKDVVSAALASFGNVEQGIALGFRGFSVVFNSEDGSFNVNVNVDKPNTKAPRESSGTDAPRGKSSWEYNGVSYTSRELLANFGDKVEPGFGEKAIDRATNWAEPRWGAAGNEPMKFSPGFDQPVKKLAAKIGAVKAV